MSNDLVFMSATEALSAFANRSLSPVELLDAVYAQAAAVNPIVNAFSDERRDAAYAAARESEARWSGRGGDPRPLEGIPTAVKEEQPIAGEGLRLGSATMAEYVADVTHPVVERIMAAGGVVHARTTTPEFSSAAFTHTRMWGVTRNPWNPDCTPGGSSGGAGASLASGTTLLATGSDIGGSIRIPSSFCGVIGFKPPYARVPALPPFNLDDYCHDGPMARTVADLALLENVIAGKHPIDPVSLPGAPFLDASVADVSGMRIAWAPTVGDFPVEPGIVEATAGIAATLAGLGATIEQVEIPVTMSELMTAALVHFDTIMGPSCAVLDPGTPEAFEPYIYEFLKRTNAAGAQTSVFEGLELDARIMATMCGFVTDYDALILPTMTVYGLEAGNDYVDRSVTVNGQILDFYFQSMLTIPFNIASRCPVVNVPSGIGPNGVPMGVQIAGPTYEDAVPFAIAAALEAVRGWWTTPQWRPDMVKGE